ncbi:MAG: hypothetical protein A2096_10055 [Spirochaetes bacterium GWF1_41_5]|nr:MAG: hypothetical protein A2096_10055 [Spirochaetes bacterium GWF1_41_5]
MIFKNCQFHNITEPEQCEFGGGYLLPRYPREVRASLSERGRLVALESTGGEIRFVCDSQNIRLFLSTMDNDNGELRVYRGDYIHSTHRLQRGVINTIHLTPPERFNEIQPQHLTRRMFSPNLWRIQFDRYCALFHGIDVFGHKLRAPLAEEKPKLRWLAYGSSITHSHINGYPQQAAWRLKVDVLNKGLSGSCHCEKKVAHFLAEKSEWDFATLELGINMRGKYSTDEFKSRADYLVKTLKNKHPKKPIGIITIFPNLWDTPLQESSESIRQKEYNEVLRAITADYHDQNLFLIEGKDILTEFTGLAFDLLHPSIIGHTIMGENLARILREKISFLE